MNQKKGNNTKTMTTMMRIIICLFVLITTFTTAKVQIKADEGISVIKVTYQEPTQLPVPPYYSDYYYSYRAVKDGETATEVSGVYGNFTFHGGLTDPILNVRAIYPTDNTTYVNDAYVVGLPEGVTLECTGAWVRNLDTKMFYMLEEAGIPEEYAKPYPTFETIGSYENLDVVLAGQGNYLWGAFKLVDEDGNLATLTGTYGDMVFTNGLSDKADESRLYSAVADELGTYWAYLFGNDDIFIVSGLPEGVHVETTFCSRITQCMPEPDDPIIIQYPADPIIDTTADYRVRHYLQNEDKTAYELKDVDNSKELIGTTIYANNVKRNYYGYEFNTEKSSVSGVVSVAELLILNLYYDRLPQAKYTVNYYLQQEDDTYKLDDTEEKFGVIGQEVEATEYWYSSYAINYDKSTTTGVVLEDGSLVLNVYYDLIYYNLYYDLGDGVTGTIPSQKTTPGGALKVADPADYDVEKYGFKFINWYEDYEGDEYDPGDYIYLQDGDRYLYAQWEEDDDPDKANYLIYHHYELGDGSYYYYTEQARGDIGKSVTATPKPDNKVHAYDSNNTGNILTGVVTKDRVLELHIYYKLVEYSVTYDGNGYTGGTAPATQTAYYNDEINVAYNTFENTGFVFDGWKDQNGEEYSEGDAIGLTENLILYAQWVKNETEANYSVIHYKEDLNGDYSVAAEEDLKDDIGKTVTATPKNYAHYTLNETKSTKSGTIPATGKLELELYYDLNQYTLTYHGNGATSGKMESKTAKYEKTFNLEKNTFERAGFEFVGWDTVPDGGGKEYVDQGSFTMLENTDLYARWKRKEGVTVHSITYKLNGGTYKGNTKDIVIECEKGSTILIHAAPDERKNYEFLYWEGSVYYPGQEYVVDDNHTFTAKWKYTGGGTKPDYNPPKTGIE